MGKVDWELTVEEFTTIQTSLYAFAEDISQKLCDTANPNMKVSYRRKLEVISDLMQKQFVSKKGEEPK